MRRFESYWQKTSATEGLTTYINMNCDGLQDDVLRLIAGEQLEVSVDGFENDVKSFKNKDDVITLLVHLGYFAYDADELLKATLAGDETFVVKSIEKIRESDYAPSFYYNEQALRYVIKYAYIVCVDKYLSIQELPLGKGIADDVFLPKKTSMDPAIIVELKWNKTSEAVIKQIKDRNYPEIL